MPIPVEVTSAMIAAAAGLGSAALAFVAKMWLDRRKGQRERQHSYDTALREDTGRIVQGVVDGTAQDRRQALETLQYAVDLWRGEARRAREEARTWEQRAQEWSQAAEQHRLEYEAMHAALAQEQRRTSQLEGKVRRLEQQLAARDTQIEELRATLVSDYARKPSTPAPPPDDSNEDETPRYGKRRHEP